MTTELTAAAPIEAPFRAGDIRPIDGNPATWRWAEQLSDAKGVAELSNVPILSDPRLCSTSLEERIAAQSSVNPYFPTRQALKAFHQIRAKGQYSLSRRNPEDPQYRARLLAEAGALNVRRNAPVPSFPIKNSERMTGVMLAGVNGMGRHSLLWQIAGAFGNHAERLPRQSNESLILHQIPVIYNKWPADGNIDSFHMSLRHIVDSNIEKIGLFDNAVLSKYKTRHLNPTAKSFTLLVSAGALIIDGINSQNFYMHSPELLRFCVDFQEHTNIPVVISCTYPVYLAIKRMPDVGPQLGADFPCHFDYYENDEDWAQLVEMYWHQCSETLSISMPAWLPEYAWQTCFGNLRFLGMVMRDMFMLFLQTELNANDITENNFDVISERCLRPFNELFYILNNWYENGKAPGREKLELWQDYLPEECLLAGTSSISLIH